MSGSAAALADLIDAGVLKRGDVSRSSALDPGQHAHSFGVQPLDRLVPEGLGQSLHMIEAAGGVGDPAAAGFIFSVLITLCSNQRPALWITQDLADGEGGRLYGPGLSAMAVDPGTLVLARANRPRDVLWAMEEALRSGAVGAVVGEMREAGAQLDLTATRRLALRSERSAVPAFLLVAGRETLGATAARTRWRIASVPGAKSSADGCLGPPAWQVDLVKNKQGPCGSATIAFHPPEGRCFPVEGARIPAQSPTSATVSTGEVISFPQGAGRRGGSL
jgi:protein ImuA